MLVLRGLIYLALAGYAVGLFTLTHVPRPPSVGPHLGDKMAHFLGYGALTGLIYLSLWVTWPRRRWIILLAVPLALMYGALDEVTQPFFGRSCELRDWLADASGAGVALLGWELLRMVRRLYAYRGLGHDSSPAL